MDVLSQVITSMRSGPARQVRHDGHCEQVRGAWLHLVLQGSSSVAGQSLSAGSVVLMPHGDAHSVDSGTGTVVDVFVPIDRSRCHPIVNDLPGVIVLPTPAGPLGVTVDLVRTELTVSRLGADAVVAGLLDTVFLHVLRAWYEENGKTAGWGPALNDPAICAVLCSIHNDPGRAWTVESLGMEAGLSRAAFARRFKELVGQPPLTYLTWARPGTASQLLRDSDAPLSVVAQQVGYGSEFAFAAAFKREFGAAPGRYRRQEALVQGQAQSQ